MPLPVTPEYRRETRHRSAMSMHYIALLFLSLHWASVLYINSSYLEQFASSKAVSVLYTASAFLTILAFLYASSILNRFGNTRVTITFSLIELCALLGMAFTSHPVIAMVLFVVHQAVVPILLFNLDIYLETYIGKHEADTGKQRGILLTIMSLTTAVAPLFIGKALGSGTPDFTYAYLGSSFFLIPFLYIIFTHFKKFEDPAYPDLRIRDGIFSFWNIRDVRNVFCAHFLLQFFFTWMVIYTPLYLSSVIGLSWEDIGAILFVGLMAYVFLEYAIGFIADSYLGEKEMMAFGFVITAIATSWFIFLGDASVTMWMFAMFMTRVGASFIETTTESYFFKHTQGKDTNVIGLFRITRPLSYVVGASFGGILLHYFTFEFLFIILGFSMVPGLFFAMALRDTR